MMQENKTKFGRNTTLRQAIQELKDNGCLEITRITSQEGVFIFEYNSEVLK